MALELREEMTLEERLAQLLESIDSRLEEVNSKIDTLDSTAKGTASVVARLDEEREGLRDQLRALRDFCERLEVKIERALYRKAGSERPEPERSK